GVSHRVGDPRRRAVPPALLFARLVRVRHRRAPLRGDGAPRVGGGGAPRQRQRTVALRVAAGARPLPAGRDVSTRTALQVILTREFAGTERHVAELAASMRARGWRSL